MSRTVSLPDDVYRQAVELAESEHVSVEDFISAAVSEQLAARRYLRHRAALANRERFLAALDQVPDVEPEDYDRL